jgi:phage gp29-like protein
MQEGVKLQNSTFIAVPYGTTINTLEVKSNGDAFQRLIDSCNTAIRRSILNQSLATAEASHNSRSAAGVHQDALGIKIIRIKNQLGETWRKSVLRFLTVANFGKDATHLTPKLDLGEGTGFPPSLSEVAQILGAGRWQPTEQQWVRFEKKYNLPVRQKGDTYLAGEGPQVTPNATTTTTTPAATTTTPPRTTTPPGKAKPAKPSGSVTPKNSKVENSKR